MARAYGFPAGSGPIGAWLLARGPDEESLISDPAGIDVYSSVTIVTPCPAADEPMQLYKFVGPRNTAVTIESIGANLPFELGPWAAAGTISIDDKSGPVNGKPASDIIRDVEGSGFCILPAVAPGP